MSLLMKDFIKAIRQCKTAAEERSAIAKECAAIRNSFRDESDFRPRNIAKLLYIHMLGYPTHFGQMECVKLIVSQNYAEKRIGYLGLMLLMDEKQEVLMLVTNSMKNDLNHANQYVVGLALMALGNVSSSAMARALASDVGKLLASNNPYIRKKAALCAIRVIKKAPELLENFVPKIKALLSERNHGVLITTMSLMIEICETDSTAVEVFRKLTPLLVRIAKNLVMSGYAPEHDVSGITDPFLQVRLLRLFRLLGRGDADASDSMSDVLAQICTNTEATRNVGNAILYECVQTIMSIEAEAGLRVLAINLLGRFLLNRDNNIRYVGLNVLSKVVSADLQAVQRHRATIVDCLKDHDVSIRRRALDLIYVLVNEGTVTQLVRDLMSFLSTGDADFRSELTVKLCLVVEKYAPSKKWHVDTILKIMSTSGEYVPEQVVSNLIAHITQNPELQVYATQRLYLALSNDLSKNSMVQLGLWCFGEYADLLVANGVPGEEEQNLPPPSTELFDAASSSAPSGGKTVSEKDLLDLTVRALREATGASPNAVTTRLFVVNALVKYSVRLRDTELLLKIKSLLEYYRSSLAVEMQQRSCEYAALLATNAETRETILDRMPPMDDTKEMAAAKEARKAAKGPEPISSVASSLSSIVSSSPVQSRAATVTGAPPQEKRSDIELLNDLFGGASVSNSYNNPVALAPALTPSYTSAAPAPSGDLLGDLLSAPSPAPTSLGLVDFLSSEVDRKSMVAFQGQGLTIRFTLAKDPNDLSVSVVAVTATNSLNSPLTSFVFRVAVPKYLRLLSLGTPSSNFLPANSAGTITQEIRIQNSAHGQKPLAMKIRMEYDLNGQPTTQSGEVFNFPPGF